MSFYSRYLFPCLCDLALGTPVVAEQRRRAIATSRGRVLEIGFGTGLNLTHYPESVRAITAVDANPGMLRRARGRMAKSGVAVEHRQVRAEELPFADQSFDTVVSTFTLCSVDDVSRTLAEVGRVLKAGGLFLFRTLFLRPPEPEITMRLRRVH